MSFAVKKLVADPAFRRDYLGSIRPKYRGLIGTLSNYIPEEIIVAAGFHPVRLIGRFNGLGSSAGSLPTPICAFARDGFAAACAGEFDLLTEVIFPNSCDSLRVLYEMWQSRTALPPAWRLRHPINADEAAAAYFAAQLRALADHLRESAAAPLAEENLRAAIEKTNRIRSLLRQLAQVRLANPGSLKGSDAMALATAGLVMDRDEYAALLEQTIETAQKEVAAHAEVKRLLIAGPLMDSIPLVETIERFGGAVVYEDTTNGARWADRDVEEEGDPYENLARRYLLAAPSPTRSSRPDEDGRAFQKMIRETAPAGIIYINQKFCEPHIHRFLALKETARQANIPTLLLEIEHGRETVDQRDLLRIESFLETLESMS